MMNRVIEMPTVRVTKTNGVGIITLARAAKLNSWTQELYDDTLAALMQCANDDEVHCHMS
jgi:enoyl-CoA hydratase/carnithine racemase